MKGVLDPTHTFSSLSELVGLDQRLQKALLGLNYKRPTLVQAKAWPILLNDGRDVLIRSPTGSGKTIAYVIPMLHKLLLLQKNKTSITKNKKQHDKEVGTGGGTIGGIILVPTKELCHQVSSVIQKVCFFCDDAIKIAILNDKKDIKQTISLRDNPNLVVATPSALLHHIREQNVYLKESVETLIVDEADLVLSFGYGKDVTEICQHLPRIFQGLLVSATLTPELDGLKQVVLNAPAVIKLEEEKTASGKLKQFYLPLTNAKTDKNLVLYVFLKLGLLRGKGLFFCKSTDDSYRLKLLLEQFFIRSAVLNAELPYRSRVNIIEQFNIGSFDYLIATDNSTDTGLKEVGGAEEGNNGDDEEENEDGEGSKKKKPKRRRVDKGFGVSRGMDFRNVSFVVNVDMPPNPTSYAHRVGRCARGVNQGVALTLVDKNSFAENEILTQIQDAQPKIPLPKASTDNLRAAVIATEDGSPAQLQPVLLDFDLQEIEGFRYRVEDVSRAVTKNRIREVRADEIKAEMLNSERLQSHFAENPADLQLLQHDRVNTVHRLDHLKHVPKYLLPEGMRASDLHKKRKKKKKTIATRGKAAEQDPLKNFNGNVTLDGVKGAEDGEGAAEQEDDHDDDDDDDDVEVNPTTTNAAKPAVGNCSGGTGRSTSGRRAWKERHAKGEFSKKPRTVKRKFKAPLGI